MEPKKTSKRRKVFPFYEHHGNLVYIGGVQRKLRRDEEAELFRVLLKRQVGSILEGFRNFGKQIQRSLGEQKSIDDKLE